MLWRWSATVPTWASSFSLFGQASHLSPFLCHCASAGDFNRLGFPSSWVNLQGSFLLSSCPASSLGPWGEFVSLSLGYGSALALWSSLLVAFQKLWVHWDSIQACCQKSSLDLDLIWTICLESPDPPSSKALFSLCSLTTHFIFFDFFFLEGGWSKFLCHFSCHPCCVYLLRFLSMAFSVCCTAVPQGSMFALLVG